VLVLAVSKSQDLGNTVVKWLWFGGVVFKMMKRCCLLSRLIEPYSYASAKGVPSLHCCRRSCKLFSMQLFYVGVFVVVRLVNVRLLANLCLLRLPWMKPLCI
jgi:hypothetical protein